MPKSPITKHSINLREGDYDYLTQVFTPKSLHPSQVIRHIIAAYVDKLRAQEGPINLDLGAIND